MGVLGGKGVDVQNNTHNQQQQQHQQESFIHIVKKRKKKYSFFLFGCSQMDHHHHQHYQDSMSTHTHSRCTLNQNFPKYHFISYIDSSDWKTDIYIEKARRKVRNKKCSIFLFFSLHHEPMERGKWGSKESERK